MPWTSSAWTAHELVRTSTLLLLRWPYAIKRGVAVRHGCGCSSVVEHNLAKVGVEGSNPFARSNSRTGIRLRSRRLDPRADPSIDIVPTERRSPLSLSEWRRRVRRASRRHRGGFARLRRLSSSKQINEYLGWKYLLLRSMGKKVSPVAKRQPLDRGLAAGNSRPHCRRVLNLDDVSWRKRAGGPLNINSADL